MYANISVHNKQKSFRLFVTYFPGSSVRKTPSATCTSDHQAKPTNSGGEHSDSTVPMQHFDTKANDETATYLSDFDFFELTASQENYLFKEIQNMPVSSSNNDITPRQSQPCQLFRNEHTGYIQTTSKFVSPVYNFNNSVVHIHHH